MSEKPIQPAFESFRDVDGSPLENGYIYVGQSGLDAVTNQISVFWDKKRTITATQPIRTQGGYLMNGSSPGSIYINGSEFSLTVSNKNNSVVYSTLTNTGEATNEVSVKDYGAVGDGVANDTAAIDAALSASDAVFFPAGTYLTSGGHNIKNKAVYGVDRFVSAIKLSGTNSNDSIFINGGSISDSWGSGLGCRIEDLDLRGNWDGVTNNVITDISNIGALVKWWAGSYVRIKDCKIQNSFGFGLFFYQLGYSYVNGSHCFTNAKNGFHFQAPSGGAAITSSSINNCSVNTCRGRSIDANTGGSGIYIKNGFSLKLNDVTIEDVDDGVRINGNDNRNIVIAQCHIETVTTACINYVGFGSDLSLHDNVFATSPAIVQTSPSSQVYSAFSNFGLTDSYNLPVLSNGPNAVGLSLASPKGTIASVTLTPGMWRIQGSWEGVVSGGVGQVSDRQEYALNTSAAIPSYSSSFSTATLRGDIISLSNSFSCLAGSLEMMATVTADTVFYLYGGASSITSSLTCAVAGKITAVKVHNPYTS